MVGKGVRKLGRTPPPLIWVFWSFLTFLHHSIENLETHLLWKFHQKIQTKKLVKCATKVARLHNYKVSIQVVHKIGRLQKFNCARKIEFNFFTAWTIFMKLDTLVHHVHGYKSCLRFFYFLPRHLVMVFQNWKNRLKSSLNFERS